jgi:hypothetical protein
MGSFKALFFRALKLLIPLARYPMRRRRCVHGRRRCVHGRRRCAHGRRGSITLFRRHLTPLLAQLLPPFRRHLAEPIEGFAHFALPFRR